MQWIRIFGSEQEAKNRIQKGEPQLVVIGKTRICLVRVEENFFAVGDKCSHNGESLSKGKINFMGEVICPWHGYRFNLKTGQCAENYPDIPIYPIRQSEDGVYIGI